MSLSSTIQNLKYSQVKLDGTSESWADISRRVAMAVVHPYFPKLAPEIEKLIYEKKFMPGGRYLYAAGRPFAQTQNCLLLSVEDSREGWADLMQRITSGLMTGAGVGVVYSKLREEGALVGGMGGKSTGPIALMQMVNEAGRHIMQGGSRRSAIWAGLHWNHPDIFKFIALKNWSDDIKAMKAKDFNAVAPMDGTNISVILDDAFFAAYHEPSHSQHNLAHEVYDIVVRQMLENGEPGFSVDVGVNAGEHLRNACTEVTSSDDNDICNLGSINLAKVEDFEEMKRVVKLATIFLLCGTLYSRVPYEAVAETRTKNRRLGLGLMGMHEWLLMRGKRYEKDEELGSWLLAYEVYSTKTANEYADLLGISRPIKTRAIAPTGTIAILAETTSGIEPIFCTAFKRRYLRGTEWHYQYTIDSTAERLIERGVDPNAIEDAYTLAEDVERRIAFQGWVQQYVDHGISSTINLPPWGSEHNNQDTVHAFGETLMRYLPQLRGVTTYPDGSRSGQPLNPVPYYEALGQTGVEHREYGNENACVGGVCGI